MVNNAPSTSVYPTHPDILRITRRTLQRVTRANKPYQQFLEKQTQKRQRIKAKQQTAAADKISDKIFKNSCANKQQRTQKRKQLNINGACILRVRDAPERYVQTRTSPYQSHKTTRTTRHSPLQNLTYLPTTGTSTKATRPRH